MRVVVETPGCSDGLFIALAAVRPEAAHQLFCPVVQSTFYSWLATVLPHCAVHKPTADLIIRLIIGAPRPPFDYVSKLVPTPIMLGGCKLAPSGCHFLLIRCIFHEPTREISVLFNLQGCLWRSPKIRLFSTFLNLWAIDSFSFLFPCKQQTFITSVYDTIELCSPRTSKTPPPPPLQSA